MLRKHACFIIDSFLCKAFYNQTSRVMHVACPDPTRTVTGSGVNTDQQSLPWYHSRLCPHQNRIVLRLNRLQVPTIKIEYPSCSQKYLANS